MENLLVIWIKWSRLGAITKFYKLNNNKFISTRSAVSRADIKKRYSKQKTNLEEKIVVEEKRKETEDDIEKGTNSLYTEIETTYLKYQQNNKTRHGKWKAGKMQCYKGKSN